MKQSRRLIFLFILSILLLSAQEKKNVPVKVSVQPEAKSVETNTSTKINIHLFDVNNQPVGSDKDMPILIQAIMPSGDTVTKQIIMKAGEHSQKFDLMTKDPGLIEIKAKNMELLEGGAHIKAKSRSGKPAQAAPKKEPNQAPGNLYEDELKIVPVKLILYSQELPSVELRFTPQRTYLADGKDTARIQAFLLDEDSAPTDIKIRLFSDGGILNPNPLVIRAGEDQGETYISSKEQGLVKVQIMRVIPSRKIAGSNELSIKFGPPISKMVLKASPPKITLLEEADVLIQFADETGAVIATDSEKEISFAIEEGRGLVEPSSTKIPSSKYESRVKFSPTSFGKMKLSSATPNLTTATVEIMVLVPVLLIVLSIVGGGLGGFIDAWASHRKGMISRTGIGIVTGLVLYWGLLYELLGEILPHVVVLNPFSGLVIAILGGWGGTKILNALLKKFGIEI